MLPQRKPKHGTVVKTRCQRVVVKPKGIDYAVSVFFFLKNLGQDFQIRYRKELLKAFCMWIYEKSTMSAYDARIICKKKYWFVVLCCSICFLFLNR
jgi:hypothetical protein